MAGSTVRRDRDRHAGKADDVDRAQRGRRRAVAARHANAPATANAEWLAQVIISSGVKRGNLIAFFAARKGQSPVLRRSTDAGRE